MSKRGEKTNWSERNRDYVLRTSISYENLIVRQLGAKCGPGFDLRRVEIFKTYEGNENPDPKDRIMLNPDQVEALIAALKDHSRWEHNY